MSSSTDRDHQKPKKESCAAPASNRRRSTLEQVLGDHGIPGAIALGVIGTICFIAVQQVITKQPIEIPKYFTELSSLIVGYYFGTHTSKKKKSDVENA